MKKRIITMTAIVIMLGTQMCHAAESVFMTINSSVNFNDRYITEQLQIKALTSKPVPKIGGEITAYIKINEDGTYTVVRFGK